MLSLSQFTQRLLWGRRRICGGWVRNGFGVSGFKRGESCHERQSKASLYRHLQALLRCSPAAPLPRVTRQADVGRETPPSACQLVRDLTLHETSTTTTYLLQQLLGAFLFRRGGGHDLCLVAGRRRVSCEGCSCLGRAPLPCLCCGRKVKGERQWSIVASIDSILVQPNALCRATATW